MQQWFNAVDQDRSGQITAAELSKALVNGNWSNFSEEACRMMIGKIRFLKTFKLNFVLQLILHVIHLVFNQDH